MQANFILSLLVLLLTAGPAAAQIEWHPYAALFTGDRSVERGGGADAVVVYEGQRTALGLETQFGGGQLTPLAGVLYRPGSYRTGTDAGFDFHRLHLPLGLGYRLLSPQFDINIFPSVAVVPGLPFGDAVEGDGLSWSGRFGAGLYLDWFTLSAYYWHDFTDALDGEVPGGGRALLTLGARF